MYKKETIEKVYETTYNLSNHAMNLLRKMILLNDTKLLTKVNITKSKLIILNWTGINRTCIYYYLRKHVQYHLIRSSLF